MMCDGVLSFDPLSWYRRHRGKLSFDRDFEAVDHDNLKSVHLHESSASADNACDNQTIGFDFEALEECEIASASKTV